MLDILIRGGTVVDGTGQSAFKADVGVVDGRIRLIERDLQQEADRTIEAEGLHVAPGFIDPHTHSDLTLLVVPEAESKIRQGVTTEVVGNCGFSPAPLEGAAVDEVTTQAGRLDLDVPWRTTAEYLERLRESGTAVNVVPLVGHNTVRGSVLGYADVRPTAEQLIRMEELVADAMEQGARGLSTGLFYPPGIYSQTDEVVALARVVAYNGGIYASHVRSESDQVLSAVSEAIEIGRRAEVRVEVAHVKLSGYRNWGDIDPLLSKLEGARGEGLEIGCDQYPYHASSCWLGCLLPYRFQTGGSSTVAQRLCDPDVRAELRRDWRDNRAEWEDRGGIRTWSDVLVSDCPERPEVVGKTIAEIAQADGQDPLETIFDLIVISQGRVTVVFFDQSEENVRALMRHEVVVVGSDGSSLAPEGILGQRRPHPRSYGAFPRVLDRYVRQEEILSLEDAIRKMTSETARRFGLIDRGVVSVGAWADLTIFDAGQVADRATFVDPHRYASGIPTVIVNGEVVIDMGAHTGALPGRVL
jgi:N-acyl-D-amino-acid deacylase